MGTHPIFESDFDCLTECREVAETAIARSTLATWAVTRLQRPKSKRSSPTMASSNQCGLRDARDAVKDLDGRTCFGRRIKVEVSHGRKRESRRSVVVKFECFSHLDAKVELLLLLVLLLVLVSTSSSAHPPSATTTTPLQHQIYSFYSQ